MTPARTFTLAIAVAVAVGLLVSQFLPQWRDEPGPRLRRECVSLVDTVLNEDRTVPKFDLEEQLRKRGINVPPFPSDPPLPPESESARAAALKSESEYRKYLKAKERERRDRFMDSELDRNYEAAMKAYEAKWEEIRNTPAYNEAWGTVFNEKRNKAIKDCILTRARREGVSTR